MVPINIRCYSTLADAAQPWQEFEKSADLYPFQRYSWVAHWYQTIGVGHGVKPIIVFITSASGEPLMMLPLAIAKHGPATVLEWLGGRLADYHAPLLVNDFHDRENLPEFSIIWSQIRTSLPAYDVVFMEKQPAQIMAHDNPFLQLTAAPHETGYSVHLEKDWPAFFGRRRTSRQRADSRRKRRRLSEIGPLQFIIARDQATADRITATMIQQKRRRFYETQSTDYFIDPSYHDFFSKSTGKAELQQMLHICALECGGRLIATHWGLRDNRRFYWYMPAFEAGEWATYSPGRLMMEELLQWSCDNDDEIFDFTIGGERYKEEWSDRRMTLYRTIMPVTSLGKAYACHFATMDALRRNRSIYPKLRLVKFWLEQIRRYVKPGW